LRQIQTDYLVVGAGAAGMAFVDALIEHADVRVTLLDRRHAPGGHWLDAYPFVRLHQASQFYGVASTPLSDGRLQSEGPEAGLHQRAAAPEIVAYYARVMDRLVASGKVTFHPHSDYHGQGQFTSLDSGQRFVVPDTCRVVDARYLSPSIPARTATPFEAAEGVRVIPVNQLPDIAPSTSHFVIVGAGKTATDAIVWLIGQGITPDAICWVRPRDPWMFDRAVVQPDPVIYSGMVADIFESASQADSVDDLFLRMEERGVMLRIDQSVTPTMAKTPTLARWELNRLRTVEHVVRLGHVRRIAPGRMVCDRGDAAIDRQAVVVHCAAPGLRYPPTIPVWGPEAITLQSVATGPIFGAAIAGYLEATRKEDIEKNRLCIPHPYPDSCADWPRFMVLSAKGSAALAKEPDVLQWAHSTSLFRSRIPAERAGQADVVAAVARLHAARQTGLPRLEAWSGIAEKRDRGDSFGVAGDRNGP
jgi:hypothetical protein